MKKDESPSLFKVLSEGGLIIFPLLLLIVLLTMGYSVGFAGAAAIVSTLLFSFFRPETRQSPRQLIRLIVKSTEANMSTYMAVIAVGILTGVMMSTMLGAKLSLLVQQLYGGSILLALIMAAVIAILLGMGLATPVIYLLCYAFIIPTLIRIGVPVIVAHLFVFGFAISAQITPPVCVAAYAAATIAKTSFWKVGFQAMQLGVAAYITPFIFAFQPALLILGGDYSVGLILMTILSAAVGLIFVASGLEGYLLKEIPAPVRIVLFLTGLILAVAPPLSWKLIALAVGLAAAATQFLREARKASGERNATA